MKIKMTVFERLIFMSVMPSSGNILTLRLAQDLRQRIGFDAKEQTEFEMTSDDGNVSWNNDKAVEKEFEFELKEMELVQGALKKLDETESLKSDHVTLWEKFMEV